MKGRLLLAALAALALAHDALGQRRRFPRRQPDAREQPAEARPEEKPAAPAKKVEHWLAITGGDVHLGTGQVLRRATVLVGDDKISAVGHDLDIPAGATLLDARGKVVTPGFVAVKGRGMGAPTGATDDVKDLVNPFDPSIKLGLAAGVTSFLASFQQGNQKPGGKTAVLKLAWGDLGGMVVAQDSVRTMRVPLSPSQWNELRELVDKAKAHLAALAAHRSRNDKTEPPKPPAGTAEVLEVLDGKARLWVSCQREYGEAEIGQALALATLFGRGVVLDDPLAAWTMPDAIAATGSMAIIDPRQRVDPDPARPGSGSNLATCAILSRAGVPVAVTPPGGRFGGPSPGTGGILGQDLNTPHVDAAFAVRGGMEDAKALRTITLDAARIVGAEGRIGSIEPGKDADLLILDGDPLHYRTFVLTAIVNGKVAYAKDQEPFYRHIQR